jgi:hypothetical protein
VTWNVSPASTASITAAELLRNSRWVITFTDTSVAPCSSLGYKVHRCGDTLFPGGVGKTSSPENFNSLLDDVSSRLFDALPDDTWFYPGHGDDSTLGEQKPHLEEWRERGW